MAYSKSSLDNMGEVYEYCCWPEDSASASYLHLRPMAGSGEQKVKQQDDTQLAHIYG